MRKKREKREENKQTNDQWISLLSFSNNKNKSLGSDGQTMEIVIQATSPGATFHRDTASIKERHCNTLNITSLSQTGAITALQILSSMKT